MTDKPSRVSAERGGPEGPAILARGGGATRALIEEDSR
jgi:hypothetical protein